jgi:hypothetical protein
MSAEGLEQMTTDELRRFAEASALTGNHRATFDALAELRARGKARDYFMDAARRHDQNKWLAYHAIVVLGPDATDDRVWDVLRQIRSETSDAGVLGGIALAERVRYLEETYGALAGIDERLSFVLDTFRTEWSPITLAGGQVDRGTDPQAVWSQHKLRRLSEEDPAATATGVAGARREGLDEFRGWAYRRFLASFLAPTARDAFRDLDPREG